MFISEIILGIIAIVHMALNRVWESYLFLSLSCMCLIIILIIERS